MRLTKEEYQKAKTAIFEQQQETKNCPGDILDALERAGFELVNCPPSSTGRKSDGS